MVPNTGFCSDGTEAGKSNFGNGFQTMIPINPPKAPNTACTTGKQYCSDACAKAPDKGLAATDCNCNHPNCAMAA